MTALTIPTEHEEQAALIRWASLNEWHEPRLAMLCAIPNGGVRAKATAGRLKAEGVRRGVPDLALFVPGIGKRPDHDGGTGYMAAALFVELKRVKGGTVSREQRAMIDALNRQGYRAEVCRGWIEAARVIADYLGRDDLTAGIEGGWQR